MRVIVLIFIFINFLFSNVENKISFDNQKIKFSKEELEWIKNNPRVKVGVDANWPPFDYVDASGKHQGTSSEYIKLLSKKTGLKFDIYSNSWSVLISKIKNSDLDVLACAVNTPNRQAYLNFSDSYLDIDLVVVGRKDNKIKSFSEIKDYKIAVQKNNFINEQLKQKFPNIEFVFVKSNEEAFKAVSYGRADFYIGNLAVITYFIEKDLLTNLEVKFKADLDRGKLSIAIYKEKEILHRIINKAMSTISEEKRKKINKKWIFGNSIYSINDRLIFNEKERKWIENNPIIKVVGDPKWPPFTFYEGGINKGLIPDIIKEIEKVSHLKFKNIDTTSWKESLDLIKDNKVHMVNGVSLEVKRDFLQTTNKFLSSHVVIIGRKSNKNYFESLKDLDKRLKDRKIGLIEKQSTSIKVANAISNHHNIIYFTSKEKTLKALSNGLIDYTVMNLPNFDYYTKKYSLSNLKILGSTRFINEYGFGVSQKETELVSILNKILKYIPKSKIDEIYRNWIKIEYGEKINYSLIWKIILVALAILLGTLYWNRKLKQEIIRRKLIQRDLEESKDFINAIMNSQKDIVIVKKEEELTQVNKAFFQFFQFDNLEDFKAKHKCVSNLFDKEEPDKYLQKYQKGKFWIDSILDNPYRISKVKIYKNNEAHVFKITASYISKKLNLKTAVLTDITELVNLNEELKKAKDIAENISKQKSEFLANMSHEIRTPMNSVIGFTEILDKEITNPIHKDYLSSIKKGGNSLLRIINDILDLSKIEAGKLDIRKESINPSSLFLEIESIFHSKIISKNIEFIVDIDENIPKYVILDGIRLRQVLFNLIGNAIKFTERGYIKLKVENTYKDKIKSKVDLTFSVEDTGIGIDEDNLEKIFNAFEQQDNQDVAKYGGTGLGLAICTKLIHLMNGKISVKSEKTKGSIFEVTLLNVPVSSIEEENLQNKTNYKNIIFERAQLLVVDDIEENRELVKASLKDYDVNITMAENGKIALDKLKNLTVDLVFLDLRMPVMNGYEMIIQMRKNPKLKNVPVIALTASVMGKDLGKVKDYGFDGYLRKPVVLQDLINEMRKFLKYRVIEEVSNRDEIQQNIDINILQKVIGILDNELINEWKDIKDKGDFSLIEEFSKKIEKIALEYNVLVLKDYSLELLKNLEAFDVEKVDLLMEKFPNIILNLRNRIKNG